VHPSPRRPDRGGARPGRFHVVSQNAAYIIFKTSACKPRSLSQSRRPSTDREDEHEPHSNKGYGIGHRRVRRHPRDLRSGQGCLPVGSARRERPRLGPDPADPTAAHPAQLAALLALALVAIFETVYVGILGTTSLAAIALVFPLIMLMQMLSAGAMGGGVSSAISRGLGAGDLERAEALHAVVIGASAGLAFSAIFAAFGSPLLRMLGGSEVVLGQALAYADIALAGTILTWLLNTFASVLRTGNMRVPSLTLLAASGLQIVLGGGLGLGIGPIPRFGLTGVATGLIVTYALAALCSLLVPPLRARALEAQIRHCRSPARDVL
jgi:hypothetical protein